MAFLPPYSGGLTLLHRPHQHENFLLALIILGNISNNIHLPHRNQFNCDFLMQYRTRHVRIYCRGMQFRDGKLRNVTYDPLLLVHEFALWHSTSKHSKANE